MDTDFSKISEQIKNILSAEDNWIVQGWDQKGPQPEATKATRFVVQRPRVLVRIDAKNNKIILQVEESVTHEHSNLLDRIQKLARNNRVDLDTSVIGRKIRLKTEALGEDNDDDDDDSLGLSSGDYVRDRDDTTGEVFRMQGDPSERRVRILDRDGRGWNIAPHRLVAVPQYDPGIRKYFGQDLEESDISGLMTAAKLVSDYLVTARMDRHDEKSPVKTFRVRGVQNSEAAANNFYQRHSQALILSVKKEQPRNKEQGMAEGSKPYVPGSTTLRLNFNNDPKQLIQAALSGKASTEYMMHLFFDLAEQEGYLDDPRIKKAKGEAAVIAYKLGLQGTEKDKVFRQEFFKSLFKQNFDAPNQQGVTEGSEEKTPEYYEKLAKKHDADAQKGTRANMDYGSKMAGRARKAAAILKQGGSQAEAWRHYQGTDKNGSEKGNPQTAFNRFMKDPKTAKKYKEQAQYIAATYIDVSGDNDQWYVKGSPEVIQRFVQLANSLEDEGVKGTEYEPGKGMMANIHAALFGNYSIPQWEIVEAQNLEGLKPIGNKVLQLLMNPDLSDGVQDFMTDFLWTLEAKGLALVHDDSQQGVAEGEDNDISWMTPRQQQEFRSAYAAIKQHPEIWKQYQHYTVQDLKKEFPNQPDQELKYLISVIQHGLDSSDPNHLMGQGRTVRTILQWKQAGQQGVAEGSGDKVHLKTPKHGLADHPGRDTGVGLRTFAQTPEQDRCSKCNTLYKNHYKQGVAEDVSSIDGSGGGDNYGGDLRDILMAYIAQNEPGLFDHFGKDVVDGVVANMVTMGTFADLDPDNEDDLEDALEKIIEILNDDLPDQQDMTEGTDRDRTVHISKEDWNAFADWMESEGLGISEEDGIKHRDLGDVIELVYPPHGSSWNNDTSWSYATDWDVRDRNMSESHIMEGFGHMLGSTKTSYQPLDGVKIIVRHKAPVAEEVRGSRSRNIKEIFIQRGDERFRMKENNLHAARAMARHVHGGGEVYDSIGQAINEMAQEYRSLNNFVRYVNRSGMVNETNAQYVTLAQKRVHNIRETFRKLQGAKTYASAVENLNQDLTVELTETDLDLESKFSSVNCDERVSQAVNSVRQALAREAAFEQSILEAIKKEDFRGIKNKLNEQDAVNFSSAEARLAYQVSQFSLLSQNARLSNYLNQISKKISEGTELEQFETRTLRLCLERARAKPKAQVQSQDIKESREYLRFLDGFTLF